MAQHIALGLLNQNQNHGEVSPSKQMRKLKIQLADRTFQLKKMQQDFAQEKAHLLMQFNQQKSNMNSTIRQLKTKLCDQNDHWVSKINQIRLSGEEVLEKNNKYWKSQIEDQVGLKVSQIKSKYDSQIMELKKNIARLNQSLKQKEKNYEKKLTTMRQNYKTQISELKQLKQTQIEQVKRKMNRDEQIKINALMHTKNGEQKEHQNTKNLLLKRERQYNEIIKRYQERLFELNQQVWSLKNKVEHLSRKSNEQNEQISKLEQMKVSTVQINNKKYEQKLQKSEGEWRKNLESLNQKWKNQYKKVQMAYQKISNVCAQKEKLWQDRGNKVLKLYQMRQARQEDVKLIEHLQVQLIKKQFELEREKQELKCCKLQLDNMDDIYKRIFNSVKKNRQSHSFQLKKMRLPGIMNKSTHPVKGQFCL